MSKRKGVLYHGLGFPVFIVGAKSFEFQGETLPKIDHNKLNADVFRLLMESRWRLTGNQLNFIRGQLGLSQKDLASRLGFDSHATVSGWLRKGDKASGMNPATELGVRMLMAHHINDYKAVNQNALSILNGGGDAQSEVEVAA